MAAYFGLILSFGRVVIGCHFEGSGAMRNLLGVLVLSLEISPYSCVARSK